jgi:phospholipid N-methyltransferase
MELDEIDIKVLRENFDDETISEIDRENVSKIMKYLIDNGVYYAKDLFISSLDLFLLPSDNFIEQFEKLKTKLGSNYVEELGEDTSLIELMYED